MTLSLCITTIVQGVLTLCEFHYCKFRYCGFSKPLLKICLMRFLCTINFVNLVIFLMRFMANSTFFSGPKSSIRQEPSVHVLYTAVYTTLNLAHLMELISVWFGCATYKKFRPSLLTKNYILLPTVDLGTVRIVCHHFATTHGLLCCLQDHYSSSKTSLAPQYIYIRTVCLFSFGSVPVEKKEENSLNRGFLDPIQNSETAKIP